MTSVAIVGFSPKTFKYVKDSKADEIWTLNYAFLVNEEFPHIDRLYEMHKRDWYLRKEVSRAVEYGEWLKQNKTIRVVMQESELTPEVPMGEAFPIKDISDKLLPNLVECGTDGELKARKYYTSSFCFMMSQAIYEGFDVIEIYGIDMEINTEYAYQKPAAEFWIGMAIGMGIKVILREESNLCQALVYGYDTIPYIDPIRLKEIIVQFQEKEQEYYNLSKEAEAARIEDPENEDKLTAWLQWSAWYYAYTGAIRAANKLMNESDSYISRQFVEIKRGQYINGMDYWKGMYNNKRAKHDFMFRKGEVDEQLWLEVLDARSNMFGNMGALQIHKILMKIMDLRPVALALTMDIAEDIIQYDEEHSPKRFMADDIEGV